LRGSAAWDSRSIFRGDEATTLGSTKVPERLLLELKGKFADVAISRTQVPTSDVLNALLALGYRPSPDLGRISTLSNAVSWFPSNNSDMLIRQMAAWRELFAHRNWWPSLIYAHHMFP
jgi:hypothetical protein